MKKFQLNTYSRIRYNETDQMGYLHHGNYAALFEIGRVEFMREIGLNYSELEKSGIMLPVLELKCKYHAPAYFDDKINIVTELREIPKGARINFDYSIFNEHKKLLTSGATQLVFVNSKTRKPMRCPKIFEQKIKEFFKA